MEKGCQFKRRLILQAFSHCVLLTAAVLLPIAESSLVVSAAGFQPANGGVFNVRDFGAVGDGKHLDSPAINAAIAECSEASGGTVFLPAGTYLSGSIHLTNNINLHLDAGTVILGAPQTMNVYDFTETWTNNSYQDGGHCFFHNSLIWGENLTNVSITGPGMINGGGLVSIDQILNQLCGFESERDDLSTYDAELTNNAIRLGNKAIALKLCRNVLIRDVTIFHGGHFAVLATGCDNLNVDNLTVDTDRDGIDIDCCRNVTVSNCRINSPNDDALCFKSSYALGRPVVCENITVANCQVSGFEEGSLLDGTMKPSELRTGRIKFGTESNGGFQNCVVANCTFRQCRGLALEEVDGGTMENITVNNLSMIQVAHYPIYITLGARNRGPAGTIAGRARNILISNVIATGVDSLSGIQITGLPDQDVVGVRLDNIWLNFNGGGTSEEANRDPPELNGGYPEPVMLGIMPSYGVFARHVRDLELANVHLAFTKEDLRPAMICTDVDGLEIDGLKAQVFNGVAIARFHDVRGLVIRNSPGVGGVAAQENASSKANRSETIELYNNR